MKKDLVIFVVGLLSGMGLEAAWFYSLKEHISNEILKVRTDINYVLSGGKVPLAAPQPIPQHKN